MKNKYFKTILMVIIVVAMLGGSTYAWFTASAEVPANKFTAGTVNISADREVGVGKIITSNWNPGDNNNVNLKVVNDGTKSIYVRAKVEAHWLPSFYRVLVIYTGTSVQLLTVEWNSFCKGFTGENGAIATGRFFIGYPSTSAYIDGTFTNLSNETYLQNNVVYKIWCLDKAETISKKVNYNVQVFDPLYNPDWYDDVASKAIWESIPWDKINYIINANYLTKGYSVTNIQDAIWHYTGGMAVTGKALEIVNDTEANWELPVDNVTFTLGAGWTLGTDGYYYYMNAIPGTYTASAIEARTIWFDNIVKLNGALTDNEYQGKVFTMDVKFEAVQSSHNAMREVWPGSPY
jgi:predicted ribosomally synthesized peptide with SipW-like signal peptide